MYSGDSNVRRLAAVMLGRDTSTRSPIPNPTSPPVSLLSPLVSLSLFARAFRGSSGSPSASNSFELVQYALVYLAHIASHPRVSYQMQSRANCVQWFAFGELPSHVRLPFRYRFYEGVFSQRKRNKKYRHDYAERLGEIFALKDRI